MDIVISHRPRKRQRTPPSRQEAVARAEAYLRERAGASVPLAELSRVVGLSERGIRNAFYHMCGMSPKRFMHRERLLGVRRALRRAGARRTTVTSVATDYGFYELGRFASTYRQLFGETPSETLRGAASAASGSASHERACQC
jgi:transcriptional regulator GlxA family with amidase domain